jgi:signal transduction histidine kinase
VIEQWRRRGEAMLAKPVIIDVLIVGLLALSLLIELGAGWLFHYSKLLHHWRLVLLLTVPMVLVFLLRRRVPMFVWAVACAVQAIGILVLGFVTNPWPGSFTAEWSMYVAVYAVAARKSWRWAAFAVLAGVFAFFPIAAKFRCECMIQLGTFLSFAAIAGASAAAATKLIEELRWRAGVLQRTREERLQLAVEQERSQVARDLHDVVAHGVTVMVVQAGAARMVARTDPQRAGEILDGAKAAAVDAITELRSLVGTLSDTDGDRAASSLPSSRDIPSLVEREVASGEPIALAVTGAPDGLDDAMELSLYRIVQEALTNARKHAPGAHGNVVLRYTFDWVEVEVTNGPPAVHAGHQVQGFGRGLIGIRERAALFGGEASAGPTSDGGFRVSARLPLNLVPA